MTKFTKKALISLVLAIVMTGLFVQVGPVWQVSAFLGHSLIVRIDGGGVTVPQGGTQRFTAEIEPVYAIQAVNWSVTGHPNVAINNVGVLAVQHNVPAGTVLTVRATEPVSGLTATRDITVRVETGNVPVIDLMISPPTNFTLPVGFTQQLTAIVAPSHASNPAIIWNTSNTGVATVAGGQVLAVSPGTATIGATSVEGDITRTLVVTVVPSAHHPWPHPTPTPAPTPTVAPTPPPRPAYQATPRPSPIYTPRPLHLPVPFPTSTPNHTPSPTSIYVIFDPNGGIVRGGTAPVPVRYYRGGSLMNAGFNRFEEAYLVPVRQGYHFNGWYADGRPINIGTNLYDPTIAMARWSAAMRTMPMPGAADFDDISADDWFYSHVQTVTSQGIFRGTDYRTFNPNARMTRAMFVQILSNLAGMNFQGGQPWYLQAVNWSVDTGIAQGAVFGDFNPYAPITREHMALMLYNYANVMNIRLTRIPAIPFTDLWSVSPAALNAVTTMQAAGVITGRPDGSFDPHATASRAEVAAIITMFLRGTQ